MQPRRIEEALITTVKAADIELRGDQLFVDHTTLRKSGNSHPVVGELVQVGSREVYELAAYIRPRAPEWMPRFWLLAVHPSNIIIEDDVARVYVPTEEEPSSLEPS